MLSIYKVLFWYVLAFSLSLISVYLALIAVILCTLYFVYCIKNKIPSEKAFWTDIKLIFKFSKLRIYRKDKIFLMSFKDVKENEETFCKEIFEILNYKIVLVFKV